MTPIYDELRNSTRRPPESPETGAGLDPAAPLRMPLPARPDDMVLATARTARQARPVAAVTAELAVFPAAVLTPRRTAPWRAGLPR